MELRLFFSNEIRIILPKTIIIFSRTRAIDLFIFRFMKVHLFFFFSIKKSGNEKKNQLLAVMSLLKEIFILNKHTQAYLMDT